MPPFASWYLCSHRRSPCPFPLNRSPVILLVPRSLAVAPNYSFLCHTCPASRLLPYLCPKILLPSVTLAPFPWLPSALPCLLPISLILFCPFPVFSLPSSDSAILVSPHIFFSRFILQLDSFSIFSPSSCCLDASRGSSNRTALSAVPAIAGTWMHCTISGDVRTINMQWCDIFAVNSLNLSVLAKQRITVKMSSHDNLLSPFILHLYFFLEEGINFK